MVIVNFNKCKLLLVLFLILLLCPPAHAHAAPDMAGITIAANGSTYTLTAKVNGDTLTVTHAGAQVATMAGSGGTVEGTTEFIAPAGTTFFVVTVSTCSTFDGAVFCSQESDDVPVSQRVVWLPLVGGAADLAAAAATGCNLPVLVYLGQGVGTYSVPAGYDHLIVKHARPFGFERVDGEYTATKANQRVFASTPYTGTVPAVYDGTIELGYLEQGTKVDTVILDDDDDDRMTVVENQTMTVITSTHPAMVQPLGFVAPHSGTYRIVTGDSIGAFPVCVQPPTGLPDAPEPVSKPVWLPLVSR